MDNTIRKNYNIIQENCGTISNGNTCLPCEIALKINTDDYNPINFLNPFHQMFSEFIVER